MVNNEPQRLGNITEPKWRWNSFLAGGLVQYSNTFWFFVGVAALSALLEPFIGYQAVGYLFLVAVLIVASLADRGPIFFGAILSTLVWNYGFIPPRFTFFIRESADVMMSVTYLVVAVVGSLLTSKIRRQDRELRVRAERTNLLYDFTRALAIASDVVSVERTTVKFVESTLDGRCGIFLRQVTESLSSALHTSTGYPIGHRALAVAKWVNKNAEKAGVGTVHFPESSVYCLPLRGTRGIVGVLMFFPRDGKSPSVDHETLLEAVAAAAAIALERYQLQESAEKVKILKESEKLYETILDSVSHELRTPITSIMGAASALTDEKTASAASNRQALTEDLIRSTERLNHIVENLLDMSRLSSGKLELKKEIVEVADYLRETVRLFKAGGAIPQEIQVDCLPNLLVNVDSKMMEHVLFNLLKNASQHSLPDKKISLTGRESIDGKSLNLDVLDEGNGIPRENRARIFQKFYRADSSGKGGIGLGLSIVKGIVEVHGGTISVLPREGVPGSCFRITLPLWKDGVPAEII